MEERRRDVRGEDDVRDSFRYYALAGSVAAFVAIWWAIALAVANPKQVVSPLAAGQAFEHLFTNQVLRGELVTGTEITLTSVLAAFLLAAAVGIPLGLFMGRYLVVDLFLDPWVTSWYSIPAIAFVPLTMNWMGITWESTVVTGFLVAVFSVTLNVYSGVRSVGSQVLEPAISYGASQAQLLSKVILPASLPSIMLGLRLGVARAIEGVVIAEMTLTVIGLGGLIDSAADKLQLSQAIALILVLAAISVALSEVMKWANRKAVPWKEAQAIVREK